MAIKKKNEQTNSGFPLGRENYILLIVGFVIIVAGFLLMIGGKSENPDEFFPEKLFSFRRITLAPIIVLFGFVFEIWAIMKKPKE